MALTAVTATAQLLLSFKKALNDAREHAETSKDIQLKQHINTAYDQMMELKKAVARVVSENERVVSENEQLTERIDELQSQREPEPEIRQVGAVHYYFVGEVGPYCQPCRDGDRQRLVRLSPLQSLQT